MQRVKVEVELTRSALATAMLNSKTTPQAASGCGIRHKHFRAQASSLRHQITWRVTLPSLKKALANYMHMLTVYYLTKLNPPIPK